MKAKWVELLVPFCAGVMMFVSVSCGARHQPADLTGIRSVGIANGMSATVHRTKSGIQIGRSSETVTVPEISQAISQTTARNLRTRFEKVKVLSVSEKMIQVHPDGYYPVLLGRSLYEKKAEEAARKQNLDSVLVIYPDYHSVPVQGARPTIFKANLHQQDSILGLAPREFGTALITAKLVNLKTGKAVSKGVASPVLFKNGLPPHRSLPVSKWKARFDDYDPAVRAEIVQAITESGKDRMIEFLKANQITHSDVR